MFYEMYETSNPYFIGAEVNEEATVITWGVDQLYIDPDSNEQEVFTEYYNERMYPST